MSRRARRRCWQEGAVGAEGLHQRKTLFARQADAAVAVEVADQGRIAAIDEAFGEALLQRGAVHHGGEDQDERAGRVAACDEQAFEAGVAMLGDDAVTPPPAAVRPAPAPRP